MEGQIVEVTKLLREARDVLHDIHTVLNIQADMQLKNDKRMDDMLLYFKKYSSGEMSMTEVINQLS